MRRTLIPLLGLALAAAACGSSSDAPKQPAASAFTDGTCRAAAPDVLAIGRMASGLGDKVSPEARTSLREAQSRLSSLAEAAEPSYKPALDALVVSTGFVRLRADGNTYEPALGKQLMADYRAVVKACTSA